MSKTKKDFPKEKNVTLRAFQIENKCISQDGSDLKKTLTSKLSKTTIGQRGMLINEGDPMEETDFIAYYESSNPNILFGAVVKTLLAEAAPHMTEDMMVRNQVVISELNTLTDKTHIIKRLYYFGISNNFVVTNLSGASKISSFETYINWLLNPTLYTLTPCVVKTKIEDVQNIKGIRLQTSCIKEKKDTTSPHSGTFKKWVQDIPIEFLKELLKKDTQSLNKILEENTITADILLKFASKSKTNKESAEKIGVLLKSVETTEGMSLKTKNNKSIPLGEVEYKIDKKIETTLGGLLSEKQLSQAMLDFLNRLEKERKI
ncbi:hypothetical protein [Segatella oris]|jgi:hypothetical protein|uniref:hypothetical protein n=1 Tax=Segatella oris TaxID=28135 RepID=UPI00241EEE71|nr:hypothetical protein [Segatella oris]